MKLDILVFAAHPDDAELACSGTIMKHVGQGYKVGIVDITQGDLGTRGDVSTRMKEAEASAKILGLSARENLKLPDGKFENTFEFQLPLIVALRKYQPEIVITNALHDRHPDHGKGQTLASDACFLAGLRKIETFDENGEPQKEWRPKFVYQYVQDRYIKPDFVVDITGYWDRKVESIKAFGSQFYDPNSTEPQTYISNANYFNYLEARAREYGHAIGVDFAEGFTSHRTLGIDNLFNLK